MLNYENIYKSKHPDWNEKNKYRDMYEHARFAADLGCGLGYNLLGCLYNHMKEKGVDTSIIDEFARNTSTTYFIQSKECGYRFALNNLGANAIKKANLADSVEEKNEFLMEAYKYYLELADENHEPYACNKIGEMLIGEYGDFIEHDRQRALEYWIRAYTHDNIEYASKWSRLKIVKYFYKNREDLNLSDVQKKIIEQSYEFIKNADSANLRTKFVEAREKVLTDIE